MIRHGEDWITNIKLGARAKAAIANQDLVDLALRAASSVGVDYAGVDIIQGRDGRFFILEVNSMPAWNGLQKVTRLRLSDIVVDAFLASALAENGRDARGEA
jgi:glutathione synthase/RimK-type ligase-like ATP-grasp enzyme